MPGREDRAGPDRTPQAVRARPARPLLRPGGCWPRSRRDGPPAAWRMRPILRHPRAAAVPRADCRRLEPGVRPVRQNGASSSVCPKQTSNAPSRCRISPRAWRQFWNERSDMRALTSAIGMRRAADSAHQVGPQFRFQPDPQVRIPVLQETADPGAPVDRRELMHAFRRQPFFHQRRRRDRARRDQNVDIRPRRQQSPNQGQRRLRLADACRVHPDHDAAGPGRAARPILFRQTGPGARAPRQTPLEMRGNQRAAQGRQGAVGRQPAQGGAFLCVHPPRGSCPARSCPGTQRGVVAGFMRRIVAGGKLDLLSRA